MENVRFVGLDVHKDSIAIAVAEPGRGEPASLGVIPNDTPSLMKRLRRLGSVKCCYEAGPTGFGLARALGKSGIECTVVAPSLVPTKAGDRVKTDRRDAVKLARFLRSGDLTPIHVPSEETEAMRDLERARDDAKKAERTARLQLGNFLLRHGHIYAGKTAWTQKHMQWVKGRAFTHEAAARTLTSYVKAVEDATERVDSLTRSVAELVETWSLGPLVKALQALRGVRLVSATVIAAELGDLRRFPSPPALMSYLGLVPSEHSSGGSKQRGPITRAGNGHVRRVLVEAAWAYRFRERRSETIEARSKGVSDLVKRIAWRAQERLCGRYRRLAARGMRRQRVVVAVARELAAFVWEVGNTKELLSSGARAEGCPVPA